ncbi:TPA: platelet-activating factor acetyltransferase activity, variant 2 [Trebouxia sp. C0006]
MLSCDWFTCDCKRMSRACLFAVLLQAAVLSLSGSSEARQLQQILPQGADACNSYVQSSCTLVLEAAERTDTCSQQNAQQMATDVQNADKSQGVNIAFYGDSITKLWKDGTPANNGMSDVYAQYFGSHSAAVLGVGGDQTGNLWWRLQNGDIFMQHPPQISIVLIGTNDLGAASCSAGMSGVDAAVSGVVSRIESILTLLKQKNPHTTVIVMGLLPRGDGEEDGVYTQPNKYTQGISNVNAGLKTVASGLSGVQFVDCGPQLLPDGKVCLP